MYDAGRRFAGFDRSEVEQELGEARRDLEATRAEHILYATRLGNGMLLGLVFDAETPFGTIRSQAGKLGSLLDRDEAGAVRPPGQRRRGREPADRQGLRQQAEREAVRRRRRHGR